MSRCLHACASLALVLAVGACQREPGPASGDLAPGGDTGTLAGTGGEADVPTTAGDAPVPAEAIDYGTGMTDSQWQCGDQRVAARFDNTAGTVTVTHDRGELLLPQATSASGARYADANGNEFWNKGGEATLTLSGTDARQCRQVAAG